MVKENLEKIRQTISEGVRLVAVSKYHPIPDLQEAYDAGQRIFGESHVQELQSKYEALPKDIEWHFIGHLQTNKVKYIAPYISLIHSVDTFKLLHEINKQAQKHSRQIDCLLQLHIAQEETKYGFTPEELAAQLNEYDLEQMQGVRIVGIMCMASNTDDEQQIEREFTHARQCYEQIRDRFFANKPYFREISMGMSGDYLIAQRCGSTLVRVGSSIFGMRNYGHN